MSILKSLMARLPETQITPRTAMVKKPSKASIQTDAPDLDSSWSFPSRKSRVKNSCAAIALIKVNFWRANSVGKI